MCWLYVTLLCGAVWCGVVQYSAVWYSVVQCVAVCCSALTTSWRHTEYSPRCSTYEIHTLRIFLQAIHVIFWSLTSCNTQRISHCTLWLKLVAEITGKYEKVGKPCVKRRRGATRHSLILRAFTNSEQIKIEEDGLNTILSSVYTCGWVGMYEHMQGIYIYIGISIYMYPYAYICMYIYSVWEYTCVQVYTSV